MNRIFILVCTLLVVALYGCENGEAPDQNRVYGSGNSQEQNSSSPPSSDGGQQGQQGQNGSQQTQPPAPQPQKISFQLPKGWEWHEEIPNKARSDHHSKDGIKPYVLFQLYDMGPGSEVDAEKNAKSDHEQRLLWCKPEECANSLKYYQISLAGFNLYISADTSDYWGNNSWYSSIAFVKDGQVFDIELDDLPENETEALKMALQTLKLK